jgi:hypothetical protein
MEPVKPPINGPLYRLSDYNIKCNPNITEILKIPPSPIEPIDFTMDSKK